MTEHSARQTRIISEAFTLLERYGLPELTTKRLAAALGVSEAALYRHFASKRAILEGMVERLEANTVESWTHACAAGPAPLAQIRAFFVRQAHQFESFPPLSLFLLNAEPLRHEAQLYRRVQDLMTRSLAQLHELLTQARASGSVNPAADPETLVFMVAGGFRLLVSSWHEHGEGPGPGPGPGPGLVERTRAYVTSVLSAVGGGHS